MCPVPPDAAVLHWAIDVTINLYAWNQNNKDYQEYIYFQNGEYQNILQKWNTIKKCTFNTYSKYDS